MLVSIENNLLEQGNFFEELLKTTPSGNLIQEWNLITI